MLNYPGILVISLDFELIWGLPDKKRLSEYKQNLLGVRQAIPNLLKLFEKYAIHATWATVGFLFAKNKDEILKTIPLSKPKYECQSLCPYRKLGMIGFDEQEDPYHYGPSLIDMILTYPFQEIGSHTYSHYYCLARGQNIQTFREDIETSINVAKRYGIQIDSFVFPGNQVNFSYLSILNDVGIKTYRGNRQSFLYDIKEYNKSKNLIRLLRHMDSHFNLFGDNTYSIEKIDKGIPINIPASQFLYPYNNRMKKLAELRLHRIINSLILAAKKKRVFHLWWHPHNFGLNIYENIQYLERILKVFSKLHDEYQMISLNMRELGKLLITGKLNYKN